MGKAKNFTKKVKDYQESKGMMVMVALAKEVVKNGIGTLKATADKHFIAAIDLAKAVKALEGPDSKINVDSYK